MTIQTFLVIAVLLLAALLYAIYFTVQFYPEVLIRILRKRADPQDRELTKTSKSPPKSVVKVYRFSKIQHPSAPDAEVVSAKDKADSFATESKNHIPAQVSNDEFDTVFSNGEESKLDIEVEAEYPAKEEVVEEGTLVCTDYSAADIPSERGSCSFEELINADNIAHSTNATEQREEEATATIQKIEGTNILEEMMSQSEAYEKMVSRVFERKLNASKNGKKKETAEEEIDIEQLYVSTNKTH